jgi:hypothetical protein
MDKLNTYIGRDHYKKWVATTTIQLGDKRELSIKTYKSNNGELRTYASVGVREGAFVTHKIFEDYSKCFAAHDVKCTENNVRDQHRLVLSRLEQIIDDVTRFYNKEPALLA